MTILQQSLLPDAFPPSCASCGNILPFDNTRSLQGNPRRTCDDCKRDKVNQGGIRYRIRLRNRILSHYGGNPPQCICCGESHREFLALDHLGDDGAEHRLAVGKGKAAGGIAMLLWIIRNDFPPIFQILCHNCNQSRSWYGECPHERERKEHA